MPAGISYNLPGKRCLIHGSSYNELILLISFPAHGQRKGGCRLLRELFRLQSNDLPRWKTHFSGTSRFPTQTYRLHFNFASSNDRLCYFTSTVRYTIKHRKSAWSLFVVLKEHIGRTGRSKDSSFFCPAISFRKNYWLPSKPEKLHNVNCQQKPTERKNGLV